MTLIPFGKPFPGIDSVSLRDGVAAGLVNGFINELKDYEKIPGLTLFGAYPFVEVEPEPPPAEAIYAARQFDGLTDRLDTGLTQCKGSTNNVSIWCWFKQASLWQLSTLVGCTEFGGTRFQFRVEAGPIGLADRLSIQMLVPFVERGVAVDAGAPVQNRAIFIAFVNDVNANRARFYWGFTPETVVEVAAADFQTATTSVGLGNPSFSGTTVNIGSAGRETGFGVGTRDPFKGIIDSVGVNFDTVLTLAQLKERAACGLNATTYHWPIDGVSPEPGIVQIVGTTVVAGICGGTA